jgi:DNA-binding NarL/FixJ family response regulator
VNILLVDDHALFRAGMRYLLRRLDTELKLDEAGDCSEALRLLAGQSYDLALLDLTMPDIAGLVALDTLRAAAPGTPIVIISGEEDPGVVRAAIEHGAMGFIPKSSTPELLIQAIALVLANGVYLPRTVLDMAHPAPLPGTPQAGADPAMLPGLTQRQMEVLRGVITGKTNKSIAQELKLSDATVKAHLTLTFRALGVSSRTEAIYAAAKLGLRLT